MGDKAINMLSELMINNNSITFLNIRYSHNYYYII